MAPRAGPHGGTCCEYRGATEPMARLDRAPGDAGQTLTNGSAGMENDMTVLGGKIDLGNLPAGRYPPGIWRTDFDWQYFPAEVKRFLDSRAASC